MKTKFLAILLVLATAIACLGACDLVSPKSEAELIEEAEAALREQSYKATSTAQIEAAAPDLAERLEAIEQAGVSIAVSGDDFSASMSVRLDGIAVDRSYVLKDGQLYVTGVALVGSESVTTKKTAELGADEIAALIEELGAGAELGFSDFNSFESEGRGSDRTIVCKDVKPESLAGAEGIFGAASLGAGIELTMKDAGLTIILDGGKYAETVLTYEYYVETENGIYNMTASLKTVYDYEAEVSVDAPADAAEYVVTDLENAMK